ncbi:hypothetical protein SAMN05428974_3256 [Sphingopyxis sp. YR583]|uniref:YciI family protein n=1 Tax=Sphingopyxis sp. YR583 TaxID=1881047 RepID=UPI0008A741D1|nr:YciI family protein [Sphingopyxis sp. YR583]SEH19168.1 hypothetical protein SAMN05428974_3256 [Sphingopyxis sp. YR583]
MPHFLIQALDRAGAADLRQALRAKHIDYWLGQGDALKAAGAILKADAPVGSFFVLEAASEDEARHMIEDDPFTASEVFAGDVRVRMVRPAIGAWLPPA